LKNKKVIFSVELSFMVVPAIAGMSAYSDKKSQKRFTKTKIFVEKM